MALFDRNNRDRDFGDRWGGSPEYGGGRNRGGGMRGMWNRVENGVRDALDRGGYDRDYSARGDFGRNETRDGYSLGTNRDRWSGGRGFEGGGYDRDYDYRAQANLGYRGVEPTGWSTGFNYDRDYEYGRSWGAGEGRGHNARPGMETGRGGMSGMDRDRFDEWDNGHKSRQQTDAGDPFGDRQSHTPIRVMRGHEGMERGGGVFGGSGNMSSRDIRHGLESRPARTRSDVWRNMDDDWRGTYRGDATTGRGWNQGIGDDPYYNRSDFRDAYDRDFRGRDRDRGGNWF
ncbi:MAG TPA: hypothetical protein VHG91_13350 [Longimicrobium sp.]|nr:hypothetical protein [Longimicrobium sp.]